MSAVKLNGATPDDFKLTAEALSQAAETARRVVETVQLPPPLPALKPLSESVFVAENLSLLKVNNELYNLSGLEMMLMLGTVEPRLARVQLTLATLRRMQNLLRDTRARYEAIKTVKQMLSELNVMKIDPSTALYEQCQAQKAHLIDEIRATTQLIRTWKGMYITNNDRLKILLNL